MRYNSDYIFCIINYSIIIAILTGISLDKKYLINEIELIKKMISEIKKEGVN